MADGATNGLWTGASEAARWLAVWSSQVREAFRQLPIIEINFAAASCCWAGFARGCEAVQQG